MMNYYSFPKDALSNPFARALTKDEPIQYDVIRIKLNERIPRLCDLCSKWLARDRKTLNECVEAQRLNELDKELLQLINKELDELCKAWQIKVKLPIERKGGFLSFFLNMVITSSFSYGRSQKWKDSDQAATDVTTYLREDGELFPMENWTFIYIEDRDEWFPEYVDILLKRLAKQKNMDFSHSWESTEWRSNERRKELFENEIAHYERDCIVLNQLLPKHVGIIKEFCKAFFLHMARHIQSDEDLFSRIEHVFNTNRPLFIDKTDKLTRAINAVHNAGICTKSDWAAVVKIMEERRFVQKAAYSSDETLINNICGETVTDKDSIARSICMSKVKGIYPDWEIRNGEETRETPNKLNHYKEIAEIFIKALDA